MNAKKMRDGINYLDNYIRMNMSKSSNKILWRPNAISLVLTGKCSCKCKFCSIWKNKYPNELSTDVLIDTLTHLGDWLGTYGLTVGGGEPFMRKDCLTICKAAIEAGATVNILTNGMHLSEQVVHDICNVGIQRMAISVDGLEGTHDYGRGVNGLFERIEAGLNRFREYPESPTLTIETIITEKNIEELPDLVKWAQAHGARGVLFHPLAENFASKTPNPKWREESEFWVKDLARLDKVMDELVSMREKGYAIINNVSHLRTISQYYRTPTVTHYEGRTCGAGANSFEIDVEGNVFFCYPLGKVGNIFEDSLKNIWYSEAAKRMHSNIDRCKRSCSLLNCYVRENLLEKAYRFLRYH